MRSLQLRAREAKQQRNATQQLTMKLVLLEFTLLMLEHNRPKNTDICKLVLVWLARKFVGDARLMLASRVKGLPRPD